MKPNPSQSNRPPTEPAGDRFMALFAACGLTLLLVLVAVASRSGHGDDRRLAGYPPAVDAVGGSTSSKSGFMAVTPEQAAKEVMDVLTSTPEGRASVARIANKDDALTEFQRQHGISERIAEAAIKEWVLTHRGNFDWDLEEVKVICLRNLRSGIPYQYLPESEKKK